MSSGSDRSSPGRILVVDDQENLCWVLRRLLTERGHEVRTASTATQALAVAAAFDPQVAVVDYRLPDGSGTVLVGRLRAFHPALKAILMTSYGSAALREEVRLGGFSAYLDKPFVNGQMIDAVEAALPRQVTA